MALMLLQLCLESLKQGECICRSAGKPGNNAVIVETSNLARGCLQHDVSERYLAVSAQRDALAAANRHDCCSVESIANICLNTRRINDRTVTSVPYFWGP